MRNLIDGWSFDPSDLMTSTEVARFWKVHVNTVANWARAGHLAFMITPGGQRRFSREQNEHLHATGAYPGDAAGGQHDEEEGPDAMAGDGAAVAWLAVLGALLAARGAEVSESAQGLCARAWPVRGCCQDRAAAEDMITCGPYRADEGVWWFFSAAGEPLAPVGQAEDAADIVAEHLGCCPLAGAAAEPVGVAW